ncbi:MAG: PD-(D/E)XK nuclease family protein [Oscillospiraceae bacterium]|nr:PD-(D/E)XK nuclease family protein [Oscillospiraceae bacterium]
MLTIVWGLAGSGKSHTLLAELTGRAGPGRRQYLLVPEQYSHENERLLCRMGGASISLHAEVLTFRRLSDRVLTETGGAGLTALDEGGRLLSLLLAAQAVGDTLRVWRRFAERPDFLAALLDAVDELKTYRIAPEELARAAGAVGAPLADKCRDLSLLLTAYETVLAGAACDPRDRLTLACAALPLSRYVQNAAWAVDGFTRFTAQEHAVLSVLLARGDVTVSLTGTPETLPAEGRFAVAGRTAAALRRAAQRAGVAVQERVLTGAPRYRAAALAHLARHLLAPDPAPLQGPADGVTLAACPDRRAECVHAAALVRTLVRDHGYRYRDIAVTARHFEEYRPLFEPVARLYELPIFLDSVDSVLDRPLPGFVSAALDAVCGGYAYDAVFKMLKSGLFGLTPDESDLLENYVLAHRIRGAAWTRRADWTFPPGGGYGAAPTEKDAEALAGINALRRRVTGPLETLRAEADAARTAQKQALSVYHFLENIDLPARLRARCEALRGAGMAKVAAEYEQMWDILAGALAQCVAILGDRPMGLADFAGLFCLVLSRSRVGAIPVSLDHLVCGDMDRIRRRGLRCVILLGATDRDIPSAASAAGLIHDDDRSSLVSAGLTLAPGPEERMDQEFDALYGILTLPSERLTVTWPRVGAEGEACRPAFVAADLGRMLGLTPETAGADALDHTAAPAPCFLWLATRPAGAVAAAAARALGAHPDWRARLEALPAEAGFTRGRLAGPRVSALYGAAPTLSASRVERFMTCRFAYFLQYGLRLKKRRTDGFAAPDRGVVVHAVLEETTRAALARGGFPALSDAEVVAIARAAAARWARSVLAGHGEDRRFVRLFARLMYALDAVVVNVAEELRLSEFAPLDVELRFADGAEGALPAVPAGAHARVAGVADRVDGWMDADVLYLRVVDYKTGVRGFRLGDVWHGLGIQMLLYLFALEREGPARYRARWPSLTRVQPAGVLYIPAHEAFLQTDRPLSDEELARAAARALTRSGLVLDDARVVAAMEPGIEREGVFLPVKFRSDGRPAALSSVAAADRFARLRRHVEAILAEMEQALLAGDVSANPVCRGVQSACEYCDFASACQFPLAREDRPRRLEALSPAAFWRRIDADETAPAASEGGESA